MQSVTVSLAFVLLELGRADEARDAARTALARGPFWSLGAPLAPTAALAGFAGRSAADIKAAVAGTGAKARRLALWLHSR